MMMVMMMMTMTMKFVDRKNQTGKVAETGVGSKTRLEPIVATAFIDEVIAMNFVVRTA